MDLNELIKSIDIVEYISQFVEMEQRGEEWWGLSPFKSEKTPSFSVRPDPPVWYDYSSGKSGNLYNFIKEYFNLTPREVIEKVKEYAGFDGEINVSKDRLSAVSICKKYSAKQTHEKESKGIILPDDIMDRFERRNDKLQVWKDEGISDESLEKFQVRYDSFDNRLVYPIRDISGKIVNIGGRTLDPNWKEKNLRKYTYRYKWGAINTIYGVAENMEYIKKRREVILFEGCKSVLLADSYDVHNTGAILTSHLSKNQADILIKLGFDVVFALDKEIRIRDDKNISRLKRYVNVYYLWDRYNLLDEKDAPVDKGEEVFKQLYDNRLRFK